MEPISWQKVKVLTSKQNAPKRIWTAGFSTRFLLPGQAFWGGYPIFDPQPFVKCET